MVFCNLTLCLNFPPDSLFHISTDKISHINNFIYLSSILFSSCGLEDKIQNCICQASSAFSQLSRRVFLNRDHTAVTKVVMYIAVCISILLYVCEAWTMLANLRHITYIVCSTFWVSHGQTASHILPSSLPVDLASRLFSCICCCLMGGSCDQDA